MKPPDNWLLFRNIGFTFWTPTMPNGDWNLGSFSYFQLFLTRLVLPVGSSRSFISGAPRNFVFACFSNCKLCRGPWTLAADGAPACELVVKWQPFWRLRAAILFAGDWAENIERNSWVPINLFYDCFISIPNRLSPPRGMLATTLA
jgi:hypothetical protein